MISLIDTIRRQQQRPDVAAEHGQRSQGRGQEKKEEHELGK